MAIHTYCRVNYFHKVSIFLCNLATYVDFETVTSDSKGISSYILKYGQPVGCITFLTVYV